MPVRLLPPVAVPMSLLHKRLWKAASGLAALFLTFIAANAFLPADKSLSRLMFGGDFVAFYTAGAFVNGGRAEQVYDLSAVEAFQRNLKLENDLPQTTAKLAPWWNPPFAAWVFTPFASLPYPAALSMWQLTNALCVLFSIALVVHNYLGGLDLRRWKVWALFGLLVVCSCPAYQMFSHGQNTGVTLLMTTLVVVCWTSNQALAGGFVAGLLFYKPQHAAILSLALALCLGRRAILGLAMSGTTLLLVNLATLPGTLERWLMNLPGNLKHLQEEVPYVWDRHVTLKAFWRLGLQGTDVGPTGTLATALFIVCAAVLAVAMVATYWRARNNDSGVSMIGPVLIASPLLLPFCFDYDLLLLMIPAGLYVSDRLVNTELTRADVLAGRLWVFMFVWTFVNPGLAGLTGLNGTVVLLSLLASVELRRTWLKTTDVRTKESGLEQLKISRHFRIVSWSEAA